VAGAAVAHRVRVAVDGLRGVRRVAAVRRGGAVSESRAYFPARTSALGVVCSVNAP